MEFELLHNADTFASILQYVKTLSDILELRVSATHLYFQTMDHSQISIVEASLPREWFESFIVLNDPIVFGINVGVLHKIVNIREKDQRLNIRYTPDAGFLEITIVGGTATKYFEIQLMDISAAMLQIPIIDYDAEMVISANMLSNIVSQLRIFGDIVTIECCETTFRLSSSNEFGKMAVDVAVSDMEEFSINEGAELTASYSLAHLNTFLSFHKISRFVDIKFSPERPFQLMYSVGNNATLKFYIAPKIEAD
jgi:proliferating cell nuclear antigen PCNA